MHELEILNGKQHLDGRSDKEVELPPRLERPLLDTDDISMQPEHSPREPADDVVRKATIADLVAPEGVPAHIIRENSRSRRAASKTLMLRLRCVTATQDLPRIVEFQRRQQECYAAFAVQDAAKRVVLTEAELHNDGVYFVIAETLDGQMVGGTRIHLRMPHARLPIEQALPHDPRITAMLAAKGESIAEYAGLWAHPDFRGTGLSAAMMSTAIAMSAELDVHWGLGFTHHHLRFWTPLGFGVDTEIGIFAYPNPRYNSYVLWVDPQTLPAASPEHRQIIFAVAGALRSGRAIFWRALGADAMDQQIYIEHPRAVPATAAP